MFFPLLYNPSDKERERLLNLQHQIIYSHQNIKSSAKNAYHLAELKFNFYKRVRKNMKLVEG